MFMLELTAVSVKDVAPEIGHRATPSLSPSVPAYFGATILSERAVDSLAVVDKGLKGEVRFLDIMRYIYPRICSEETPEALFHINLEKIMNLRPNVATLNSSLLVMLMMIESSRTAQVFITQDSALVGYVNLTDVMKWLVHAQPENSPRAIDIATLDLVVAEKDAAVDEVFELMLGRYVRRILILEDGEPVGVIDDRALLNMIFGSGFSKKSFSEIAQEPIKNYVKGITKIKNDATLIEVAQEILRTESRCEVTTEDGFIITPWDTVIKGLNKLLRKSNVGGGGGDPVLSRVADPSLRMQA